MEREVTLQELLTAREQRAQRQRIWLKTYGQTLVVFTMNIAGPIKRTELIEEGFSMGSRLLRQRLGDRLLHWEEYWQDTGCEGFYAAALPAEKVKAITVELEETHPAGRLWDMDVLTLEGKKLERENPRACLICGTPGAACARSRAHSVEELTKKTEEILKEAIVQDRQERAAALATRALLYEVCITPKPGLVDRDGSGSHRDMDLYRFLDSVSVLTPYFSQCVGLGWETREKPPGRTLDALRKPGQWAEAKMLSATGGVNTHKGAIFTMGILCGALGRLPEARWGSPELVLQEAAEMTKGLTQRELSGLSEETAVTAGQKLYLQYGITGVRGQLEAGLPTVLQYGLPTLEDALQAGHSWDEAGAAALMALIAHTPDTNLMKRGGMEAQKAAAEEAADLLRREPVPGRKPLQELDQSYKEKNLSPGGCADLLAVCLFLHFLREESKKRSEERFRNVFRTEKSNGDSGS